MRVLATTSATADSRSATCVKHFLLVAVICVGCSGLLKMEETLSYWILQLRQRLSFRFGLR